MPLDHRGVKEIVGILCEIMGELCDRVAGRTPIEESRVHPYANLSGNSGVRRYQIDAASIVVEFLDGSRYLYSDQRPGRDRVEEMKRLAQAGRGLSTYISTHVKDDFERRLR